jgi:uncharacterized repeat protein (TIGR03803 family)
LLAFIKHIVNIRAGMNLRSLLLTVMLAGCLAMSAKAQSFSNLYNFTATNGPGGTNNDGASPFAGLTLNSNILYGTAYLGGTDGYGSVFAIKTNGAGFTNLHSFTNGNDGASPDAVLVQAGNLLYGTADTGGASGEGTVFAVNTSGTFLTNLHSFSAIPFNTNSDGAVPQAGLLFFGANLYGTVSYGGNASNGTVFVTGTNGGLSTFYNFTGGNDGSYPLASLIESGSFFYGTTLLGGSAGYGVIFAVNTNGSFSTLHAFTNGTDGAYPWASLILAGTTMFGTSSGINLVPVVSPGSVFKVNIDGTGFTPLHDFSGVSGEDGTNSDGANPVAGLVLSGVTLYGTAENGGLAGLGTIFSVDTNGQHFTTLYNFTGNNDGAYPAGQLVLANNILYGITSGGGAGDNGTVFALNLSGSPPGPIRLNIQLSGNAVVLSWTAPISDYFLQSSPSVSGGFSVIEGATSPYTNMIADAPQFFRLMANH